jgi:hypothetical protein
MVGGIAAGHARHQEGKLPYKWTWHQTQQNITKATLILTAIASLVVTDYTRAQIPNTWTRDQLVHLHGSRAVNIERAGSELAASPS